MTATNNIPETALAKWEVEELVDDAIASGHDSEFLKNEFIYEFRQGGKVIRGLTASMYAHLALGAKINIEEVDMETVIMDENEYVRYTVIAIRRMDGELIAAHGTACEPQYLNGKFDKYCFQKALTKAARNARKQLLPFDMILKAIEELAELPSRTAVPTTPKSPTAMEVAFSYYEQHRDELPSNFWDRVRERFGHTSRATMTTKAWKQLPDFIDELLKESEQASADEVHEPDPEPAAANGMSF